MLVAADTETLLFHPGMMAPPIVCMSTASATGVGLVHGRDPNFVEEVRKVLRGHSTWANGAYDLGCFVAWYPELWADVVDAIDNGRVHDVQIRQRLLDLASHEGLRKTKGSYSLAGLVKRLYGVELEKEDHRTSYGDLWDVVDISQWSSGFQNYAILDSVWTLKVHEYQDVVAQQIQAQAYFADLTNSYLRINPLDCEFREIRAAFALRLASCWGVRTDREKFEELKEWANGRAAEIEPILLQHDLLKPARLVNKGKPTEYLKPPSVKVTRTKDLVLQDPTLVPLLDLTPMGQKEVDLVDHAFKKTRRAEMIRGGFFSVPADLLEQSQHPGLKVLAEYKRVQNIIAKDLPMLKKGLDFPIHARMDPLSETGRVACSSPNLMNIKKDFGIRNIFRARDGWAFVAIDYEAAELFTLAQTTLDMFGQCRLAEVLNKGIDPHSLFVAEQLMDIPLEKAMRLKEEDDPEFIALRNLAKAANFGYPGAMGPVTFQRTCKQSGIEIDLAESTRLRGAWCRQWPWVYRLQKYISDNPNSAGGFDVVQPVSQRIRANVRFTEACNSPFQGRTADAVKHVLWLIAKEQYTCPESPLYGTRTTIMIHDEIMIECPIPKLTAASARLKQIMEQGYTLYTPDIPARCDKAVAMIHWDKKAKPTFNDLGELIPWEHRLTA